MTADVGVVDLGAMLGLGGWSPPDVVVVDEPRGMFTWVGRSLGPAAGRRPWPRSVNRAYRSPEDELRATSEGSTSLPVMLPERPLDRLLSVSRRERERHVRLPGTSWM
jgi:hypothetical protein